MTATLDTTMSIHARRAAIEAEGGRVRYYKAWPRIGRGGVRHDLATHEEIERMLDRGVNPPLWRRIANVLEGKPWR